MGNNLVCNKTSKERHKKQQSTKENVSSFEQELQKCKICRENIQNKIRNLELISQTKQNKAKELLKKKDRERAKVYLKQSKCYQKTIQIATGQLNFIEQQIFEMERTQEMKDVYKTLEQGNKVLKNLQENINAENFEQIKKDLHGFKEQNDEINKLFDKYAETEFDKDVAEELEQFEKELEITSQQRKENKVKLPEAPKNEIKWKEVAMMNES